MKLSTEYDSEINHFINKASLRILNGIAKVKASVQTTMDGTFKYPLLGVFTKYASLDYDVEDNAALVTLCGKVKKNFEFLYRHEVKVKEGSLELSLKSTDLNYRADFSYLVQGEALSWKGDEEDAPPIITPVRAKLTFPNGQLVYVPATAESAEPPGLSATVGVPLRQGLAFGEYSQATNCLDLRYTYKDDDITISPMVSIPSGATIVNFKRQFGPAHKLSFMYDFRDVAASAVYKFKRGKDAKAKLGYDSRAGLFWGSLWVGEEGKGAKAAPGKIKAQVMVQVSQDDWRSPAILFKVKKRLDF